MDARELAGSIRQLIGRLQSERFMESVSFQEANNARAQDDPVRAVENVGHMLKWNESAVELRDRIALIASELCEALGSSGPRSLHEFAVHMQPRGDEKKAIELWPAVEVDLRMLPDPVWTDEQVRAAVGWEKKTFQNHASKMKRMGRDLPSKTMPLSFWKSWLPDERAKLLPS